MKKVLFSVLCVLVFWPVEAHNLHNITVEMGLSNSTTFSVIKDQRGLMWFSTKEGIDRYDGNYFKNYALYPSEEITQYGLRRNRFHIDNDSKIWVYNYSDIFAYNQSKDCFDKIYSVGNGNTIRDVFVRDNRHTIYIAVDEGLLMYNPLSGDVRRLADVAVPIVSIARYSDNTLILVSRSRIFFFDTRNDTLDNIMLTEDISREISMLKDVSSVCVDRNKNIFLASLGQISAFNVTDLHLRTNAELNRAIGLTVISKIITDKEGFIFFGTPGQGLFKIDSNLQLLSPFYKSSSSSSEINTNEVSDIFIDDENRLWLSGYGISYLNDKELNFLYYCNDRNDRNTLHHNGVRSFIEDDKGNLWVGTNYGISILSKDRQRWRYINPHSYGHLAANNKIFALAKDDRGNIIAGTAQDGLFCIAPDLSFAPMDVKNEYTYRTSINALFVDGEYVWSGGAGSNLEKRHIKTGTKEQFPIVDVLRIIKGDNGEIICGGHNGLHFISTDGQIRGFNAGKYNIGSIFCVTEDSEGVLWLASEGQGLIRFDHSNERFTKFTVVDGLSSNLVYGIEEDLYGNLWLSTTKGLSCFNIKNETFKNYTLDDGLPIKEFAYGAYGKTKNNEIIFGGNTGFIIFNPKELLDFNLKTNLIITDFKIFNKSVEIDAPDSPLDSSIDEARYIKLNHDQNSITFEFSSINLVNKANYYRRKLEGLDQEWSPITKVNYVNYTNLRPGSYKFIIQWANTNSQAEIVKNSREIDIEIVPPFWKTIWAYVFYTLLAIGLIYAVVKFYLIKISEKQAKDKIRFFVNIVHDIRTPLSLIKSPLRIAIKKRDFSDETLDILKKANNNASRLTKLADQLLDFERKNLKKSDLKLSYIDVNQTLSNICEDFIPLMEQRGIVFTQNYQSIEEPVALDVEKFDKIIFNLLSNAIKYTHKAGQIAITTSVVNKKIQISIADNGIGIPKEQQKQLFKRYFRADNIVNSNATGFGIGLMITKELVTLHGGHIWCDSVLNKGTTFFITFPTVPIVHSIGGYGNAGKYDEQKILVSDTDSDPVKGTRKPKILVVEDNDHLREFMVLHLQDDYKVITAVNGEEALNIIHKTSVDVVISDVMMPVMDGSELCFEIKNNAKTNHIPVILLTALSSSEHKAEGYKIGADIYMSKPVDIGVLINCINNLLDNRKKIKEKFINERYGPQSELNEVDKKFMAQVQAIVAQNLSNSGYSVEDMEREMGISHAQIYRKFKSLFGETPLEFIQHYRLNKSVELLQSGNYYVNEIAYMVGFSDPKYFSVVFKRYFGKNASDFLKDKK